METTARLSKGNKVLTTAKMNSDNVQIKKTLSSS